MFCLHPSRGMCIEIKSGYPLLKDSFVNDCSHESRLTMSKHRYSHSQDYSNLSDAAVADKGRGMRLT